MAGAPLYTNKDAARQYWMRGPWTETVTPNSAYDDRAAAERAKADAALASASRFLGQRHVVDDANDAANRSLSDTAADKAAERLTTMGRLKAYGAPLAKAGAEVGLPIAATAFAPIGAGTAALMGIDALGNIGGQMAGRMLDDQGEEPMDGWDIAKAGAAGAAFQGLGPAMRGVGKVAGAAGDMVPPSMKGLFGLGSVVSGHPGALTELAMGPLGRGLQKGGNKIEELVNLIRNTIYKSRVAPEVGAFEREMPNVSGYRPTGPRATGQGAHIGYSEPTPYTRPTGVEPNMPNTGSATGAGAASRADTGSVGYTSPTPYQRPAAAGTPPSAAALGVDRYMPNVSAVEPEMGSVAVNGSGESGASQEAINRLKSMTANGKQFGVYNRGGQYRPILGPTGVDYQPAVGETFGEMGPNGFQVLTDNGGRVVPRSPMGGKLTPQSYGDEYSGVREAVAEATARGEKGGLFNPNLTQLNAEELAAEPEFTDSEIDMLMQSLQRAAGGR